MTQLQVRLHRDSFTTPWGFRLQGGRDIGPPLTIQRVFSNSPAEGELQRGDRVLSIGGYPGTELTNHQAQDIARRPLQHIDVTVFRPVPSYVSSSATFTPLAQRPRASSVQLSPVQNTMPGGGMRLNTNPCYNPGFRNQFSPSSPHPPPPWTRQNFAPQKVSRLSELGGGAPSFGVDYGSKYGTVPRRRHSQPPVNRQPVVHHTTNTMPVSRGGFTPKKITLSRLGGGGPDFGSDFTRLRPQQTQMQPVHVHTVSRAPGGSHYDPMVSSMDGLSLSPRTPDLGYQAPPFSGGYIPTAVRLDMEREQEMRQQQQQQQQQHSQPSPHAYQDFQPSPPAQQQYYFEPQPHQPYVPTGVRLDLQMGEPEEQQPADTRPVLERRRAFMNAPERPAPAPTGKSTAPKVLRPKPGPSAYNFGVDYTKQAPKTSSVTWRPQTAPQRPVNAAPAQPEVFQPSPAPWSQQVQQQDDDEPDAPPAWRNTLRTTGVKPWDKDLEYSAQQQAPVRSNMPVQNPEKAGDRDWTQSAVYRMIYEEEHRGRPQQQQQQQQQPKPAPPTAPKPQAPPQPSFQPAMDAEYGTSDF